MKYAPPHILQFKAIGASDIGYISVAQYQDTIPFPIARAFWTYYTPHHVIRGRHAHHKLEQVLVAVAGAIEIKTESRSGEKQTFLLDRHDQGLYLPPPYWHTMQFSHNAVLLGLASIPFDEKDYIREYEVFKGAGSSE